MSNPPRDVTLNDIPTRLRNSSRTALYAGSTRRVNTVPESMIVPDPVEELNANASVGISTVFRPTLIPIKSM